MNCPNCNAPLAEGAAFCGTCGMPIQQQAQPQQPNMQYQQPQMQYQQPQQQYQDPQQQYQQPQQQYQQPQQQWQAQQPTGQYSAPGGSFIDKIKANPLFITSVVGYFFLFIVAWFPRWVSALGSGAGLFASDGGILKLWAILFLLLCACGVIVEIVGENNASLGGIVTKFKSLPFSQFYIPAVALILWILCITNSTFRLVINSSWGLAHWGFCMYLCIIAIILLLVRPVMALIQKKPFWS